MPSFKRLDPRYGQAAFALVATLAFCFAALLFVRMGSLLADTNERAGVSALHLSVLVLGGAVGGLLSRFLRQEVSPTPQTSVPLPVIQFGDHPSIELGFVGDCLIGIVAAFAASTLVLNSDTFLFTFRSVVGSLAFGVGCGLAGRAVLRLLQTRTEKLIGEMEETRRKSETEDLLLHHRFLMIESAKSGGYPLSAELCMRAIQADPTNPRAYFSLGWVYAKKAESLRSEKNYDREEHARLLSEAIKHTKSALDKTPTDRTYEVVKSQCYYNLACLKDLAGDTSGEVISDLRRSFALVPSFALAAEKEVDLSRTRETSDFKEMVEYFRRLIPEL